jgi:hypothetical protein
MSFVRTRTPAARLAQQHRAWPARDLVVMGSTPTLGFFFKYSPHVQLRTPPAMSDMGHDGQRVGISFLMKSAPAAAELSGKTQGLSYAVMGSRSMLGGCT